MPDLQDQDPKRFRTKGLRNLARQDLRRRSANAPPPPAPSTPPAATRPRSPSAVLLGQAIGVPVYYKHELFSEIIAFPPMPVALDFEVWMRASGMLFDLEHASGADLRGHLRRRLGREVREPRRAGPDRRAGLPRTVADRPDLPRDLPRAIPHRPGPGLAAARAAGAKTPATAGESRLARGASGRGAASWTRVTSEVPQVVHCATFYFNPDLAERTRFRLGRDGIEGIYSDGSFTVKFRVETPPRRRASKPLSSPLSTNG